MNEWTFSWATNLALAATGALACSTAAAGGPFTNGTSARAQSMQNAFSAVADDSSSVYYNPAGLAGLVKDEFIVSAIQVSPSINFTSQGQDARSTSNKAGYGPSAFVAHRLNDEWVTGFGFYAPAARVTAFDADPALGGVPQHAKLLRIDIAVTASRSFGPLAIGFGPVLSRGTYESSVLGFDEHATGLGASFQIGALATLERGLKVGGTYRSESNVRLKGSGAITGVGAGSFTAIQRYPAVVVVGLAWSPPESRITVAADVELQNWSKVKDFNRNYSNPALNALGRTTLNAKDSMAYRIGGFWRIDGLQELRAGVSYTEAAIGSEKIIPAQPDFDIVAASIGYGYKVQAVVLNIGFEYQSMKTRFKAVQPFPGKYEMSVRSILVGAAYTF